MKYLQNLHTHTNYCDGRNTAEEMILAAIELGFTSLGFSGHAPMPASIPADCAMTAEDVPKYKAEISALREKYADKIEIFLGTEFDAYSEMDLSGLDYIIGSVHYIKRADGSIVDFDLSPDAVKGIINGVYGGYGMQFAKEYYEEMARMPERIQPDIVGHFDIVTKTAEVNPFIDMESKEYKGYALEALHAISKKCRLFEVNTGAIPRGYRTSPYPAPFILKEMKTLGLGVVISSDCHFAHSLNAHFDTALELIKECGFTEVYTLTKDGFKGNKI